MASLAKSILYDSLFYLSVWCHRLSFFFIACSPLQKTHMLRNSSKSNHTHTHAIFQPPSCLRHLLNPYWKWYFLWVCVHIANFSHDTSPPVVSILARAWCIFRIIRGGQHAGHRGLSDVICWVCSYDRLSKHSSANHHSNPQAVVLFPPWDWCHELQYTAKSKKPKSVKGP